jgi:hypothetical protein
VVRKGSMISHSSSVSSPRITANLPSERSVTDHTAPRRGKRLRQKEIMRIWTGPPRFFLQRYTQGCDSFIANRGFVHGA